MFELSYTNSEQIFSETNRCIERIEGIGEFIAFQNKLYQCTDNYLCFGDDQIDSLSYYPERKALSVRITTDEDREDIKRWFVVLDFFDVEIKYFDIAPEHYIDELVIEQNKDGKYSISFGTGELDFRYANAKLNRFWTEE